MAQKYFILFFTFLLLNSCNKINKPFEEIHGRIIPDNDQNYKTMNIINNNIQIEFNKYDEEIIYSNDGKYKIIIYSNIETKKLKKYSDEYIHKLVYNIEEWYNILNVIRIYDNEEIIRNYYINPDDKILICNDKLYCHVMNLILELDLINLTEKGKYWYNKLVEVNLIDTIDEYLILTVEEHGLYGFYEDEYKLKKKEFKIKI